MEIPSEETRGQHVRVSSAVMAFPHAEPARIDRPKSLVGSRVPTNLLDLQRQTLPVTLAPHVCQAADDANTILTLRCLVLSGRFDDFWERRNAAVCSWGAGVIGNRAG